MWMVARAFESAGNTSLSTQEQRNRAQAKSRSGKAGLEFSVARAERTLRAKCTGANGYEKGAAVYLAAFSEYVCAEVLETAAHAARDDASHRICVKHIYTALDHDEGLHQMMLGPRGMCA